MFRANTQFLVVDPQLTQRSLIIRMLRELGFEHFREARNGEVAWQELVEASSSSTPIDVVICDLVVPRIKGLDLLKMAQSDERLKNIPFVFMTPESDQKKVVEAIKWGASHYLTTPFTNTQLLEKLKEVYARAKSG